VLSAGDTGPMAAVEAFDDEAADRLRAAIGKLSRRLRTTVGPAGLTPSQMSVLFTVVRRGPLGLADLAEVEAMNPTMVSRITTQLSARTDPPRGAIGRSPRGDRSCHGGGTTLAPTCPRRAGARVERVRGRA
jgi:hypothetical protein